jgi:hypothetical protein
MSMKSFLRFNPLILIAFIVLFTFSNLAVANTGISFSDKILIVGLSVFLEVATVTFEYWRLEAEENELRE